MKKQHENPFRYFNRPASSGKKRTAAAVIVIVIVLILAAAAVFLAGRLGRNAAPRDIASFNSGKYTVGVVSGYIFGEAVERALPEAGLEYFDSREAVYRALYSGAVDAVADDEAIVRAILRSNDAFTLLDGYLEPSDYAFIFPKTPEGEKISREFGTYIDSLSAAGGLAVLDEKWFGGDTDNKTSKSAEGLPAAGGTLTIAFDDSNIPFAYLSAGRPVGYDIDLAVGFCEKYGYGLELVRTGFSEMLQGTSDGRYDAGCGAVTVTEERKKDHYFSSPDYSGGISLCMAAPVETGRKRGIFADLGKSLKRTLEDGRASRFLGGIAVTLIIVLSALAFGTPFGLILYITGRRAPFIIRNFVKFMVWILHGIPAVMLILMLYYRHYKDLYRGGTVACAIGLMLVFSVEICRILEFAAQDLDAGQTETRYRLEFIDSREYFGRLFAGRGNLIVRAYRERAGMLVKASAVAGYAGVQDMTKVFDLIRMESYETAMPLFLTASAYFLMIRLITRFAGRMAAGLAGKIRD